MTEEVVQDMAIHAMVCAFLWVLLRRPQIGGLCSTNHRGIVEGPRGRSVRGGPKRQRDRAPPSQYGKKMKVV